jgi:hypothetical protein
MMTACTALKIFVDAADAAGKNLTYDTWLKGLESLGKIDLPTSPVSSFGPDKPDAQDSFQLAQFNTAWTPGSSELLLLPLGDGITQTH